MTIPTISTLPTAPARTDPPATFVTRADSFLAALIVMQSELNTSIGAMNTDIAGVNTDATAAAASASAAATSESNASTSETNAATSETNAASSAAAAASTYDQFDDRYLGSKASDPAVDNDGNALLTGALYFNSTSDDMKVYTGTTWKVTGFNPDSPTFTDTVTAPSFDINSIAATNADTAVDIFIYDTRKDSDGGAWRKRTQNTSWYNETLNTATRGSRREFPAVAVIVAESSQVTIYDGDDPSLPMWMVFNRGGSGPGTGWMIGASTSTGQCVAMLNGALLSGGIGSWSALNAINFISDNGSVHRTSSYYMISNILNRNSISGTQGTNNSLNIVSDSVNDVAMTVLPNAPIDAATGLPVPTIAVATDGGVSVIKDDGTVVDLTYALNDLYVRFVDFVGDGLVYGLRRYSTDGNFYFVQYLNIPSSDTSAEPDRIYGYDSGGNRIKITKLLNGINTSVGNIANMSDDGFVFGSLSYSANTGTGIYGIKDSGTRGEQLFFNTTSDYNTGWMNGDIKLATLSDTDDTNITGSELASNNYATVVGYNNTTNSISASEFSTTAVSGQVRVYLNFATVIGETYTVIANKVSGATATLFVREGSDGGGTVLASVVADNQVLTFTATTTAANLLWLNSTSSYAYDNISVRIAVEDRSVNDNGLQVFGTITKTPVATGADLVAYSGFSASNYLEQPYNSDLDFGTGDYVIMSWIYSDGSTTQYIFDRQDGSNSATDRFNWGVSLSGTRVFNRVSETFTNIDATIPSNVWSHLCNVRRDGVIYCYVNGVLAGSSSNTSDNTDASASFSLIVGTVGDGSTTGVSMEKLALLRISATAPTAEQIAKIYEDEKVLFQENAQATLYGSSDAVTALAYDDDTELLHVGTSAGRSVFQGLRRVDNTTGAVGAAISASNGLVAED